jgi:hypothetical protein
MSVSALLMLVVEALVSKLGSQYLGALLRAVLDMLPERTVIAANGGVSDVPATALAAPAELKSYTQELLQKLVNAGNLPIYARVILNQVIKFLPELEDSLWNMLFSKGIVATSIHPMTQANVDNLSAVSPELLDLCKM